MDFYRQVIVKGTLLDDKDEPVAGAEVLFYPEDLVKVRPELAGSHEMSVTTDSNGYFERALPVKEEVAYFKVTMPGEAVLPAGAASPTWIQVPVSDEPLDILELLDEGIDATTLSLTAAYDKVSSANNPTILALAAQAWTANAIPVGTGVNTLSQVTLAANKFLARASSGNVAAQTVTDFALTILDDANAVTARGTLGLGTMATQNIGSLATTTMADGSNIVLGTGTGTQIGTSSSQMLAFWGKTPVVQPTTSVASAAMTANSGTNINDASTFAGYTVGQIVRALRNVGILA